MTYLSENARDVQTCGMTRREAILYTIDLDGMADETVGDSDLGEGVSRIGRHLLAWNGHGFFSMASYSTEDIAVKEFAMLAEQYDSDEC